MYIENGIGVFPNFLDDQACDAAIELFSLFDSTGLAKTRQELLDGDIIEKDDKSIVTSNVLPSSQSYSIESYAVTEQIIAAVWKAYVPYNSKYTILRKLANHWIFDCKIQKTEIGGGYHIWHCEHGGRDTANRLLAYTVYLNDVEEGGETEFLYIPKRISPKKGTVCLFPASFTHTHRGNPPISNVKYISTGWITF